MRDGRFIRPLFSPAMAALVLYLVSMVIKHSQQRSSWTDRIWLGQLSLQYT